MQYSHLLALRDQLAELGKMLQLLVAEEEAYQRLMQLPGLGVITATLLGSELDNGSAFRNGRAFAVHLGLTPGQHSSGGKSTLLGITKRGNRYLRILLSYTAPAPFCVPWLSAKSLLEEVRWTNGYVTLWSAGAKTKRLSLWRQSWRAWPGPC
jgi:transposase